ncbi:leucine rich repeat protein, partial [Obelidium mucronatum]
LDLHHNAFTGPIPACIGKLVGLVELHLSSNCLEGEIPSEIGCLVNLKVLALSDNSGLSGTIPASFSNLSCLEKLDLSQTSFSGPLLVEATPTLQVLNLSHSPSLLNGTFQTSLAAAFLNLQNLSLQGCQLSGPFPKAVFDLANLRKLDLSDNTKISGKIPSSICKLIRLQFLNLARVSLVGPLPKTFGKLATLRELDFTDNPSLFKGSF